MTAPGAASRTTRTRSSLRAGIRAVPSRLGRRLARLGLAKLPAPAAVLVVLCWLATAVLLVFALIPGALESLLTLSLFPTSPRWFRSLLLVACAFVAAGSLLTAVLHDRRAKPSRSRMVLRDAATVSTGGGLGFLLLASGAVIPGMIALGAAVATVVLLHVPRVARTPAHGEGARAATVGTLGAVPWLAATAAQFGEPDAGLFGWVWIVLLPLAAAFAAFGALYGVARAAESRVDRIRFVFRGDVPVWALVIVLLAGVAVVATRYTVLRGLFGGHDALLWTFGPSFSWVHAGLVAAAVTVAVAVSTRRPLTRVGRRFATAAFGAAAALQVILLGPLIITLAVSAILTGSGIDGSDHVVAIAPWATVAIVVALAVVVAHPVFAGSAGRWMTWLGAFYVIPGSVASAAGPLFDGIPSFWAKPSQVATLLVVGAAVLFAVGIVRPALAVPRQVILRVAVIPLVAVHATALLPAPWESTLGRVVLVAGVVVAMLFFAPRVTADPVHRAERLLGRTVAQLAGLVVFVLALPSVLSGETFGVVGTLWLAVPVAVVLCLALLPRTTPVPAGTPRFLIDADRPDESRVIAESGQP